MTSLRDRLFVLMQHGDFDAHLAAAVLDLDIADVEHALSDPNYSPPGGGGGFSLPPTLTIGDDGSLHWNDGENPSQIQLALDPNNEWNGALGVFPDNGNSGIATSLYGGTMAPDGTGNGGYIYSAVDGTSATSTLYSAWSGGSSGVHSYAGAYAGLAIASPGGFLGFLSTAFDSPSAGLLGLQCETGYSRSIPAIGLGEYGNPYQFGINHDGSMHWADGAGNPSQIQLALDPVNEGNFAVALFPENGSPNGTIFSLYGGDMQPDGTGTNSPTVYMEAAGSSGGAVLDLASDWFGGPSVSFRASQSSPHGTNSSFGEYNTGGHIALDTTDLTGRVTLSANGTNLGGDFTGRPALELLDNSANAEMFRLDFDGSMHWGDVMLASDPNNESSHSLALFPDNGGDRAEFSIYGGSMQQAGGGSGALLDAYVGPGTAELDLAGAWSGPSGTARIEADLTGASFRASPASPSQASGRFGVDSSDAGTNWSGTASFYHDPAYAGPVVSLADASTLAITLEIDQDGSMHWGDGTNPPDVALHRAATGVLQIDQHGGGLRLTSPDGAHTKTLTIDNTGALALA